jgi:hypothetical protein
LGIAAVAACSILPIVPDYQNPFDSGGFAQSVSSLAGLFIVGGSEYSIFGYQGRSQFFLGVLAVFLLRWQSRFTSGYVLAVLLSIFHQSLAGMFLLLLLAVDAVARPQVLDRKILSVVGFGVVAVFARETLITRLGLLPAAAIAAGLSVLIAFVVFLCTRGAKLRALDRVERCLLPLRRRFDRIGLIGTDLLIGLSFWVLALPVAAVMSRSAVTWLTTNNFWSEAILRVLMLMQPVVFVGLAVLLIRWLEVRIPVSRRSLHLGMAALAIAVSVPVLSRAVDMSGPARAVETVSSFNQLLAMPLSDLYIERLEAALYYAMSTEVDTGAHVLRPMLMRK